MAPAFSSRSAPPATVAAAAAVVAAAAAADDDDDDDDRAHDDNDDHDEAGGAAAGGLVLASRGARPTTQQRHGYQWYTQVSTTLEPEYLAQATCNLLLDHHCMLEVNMLEVHDSSSHDL